MGHMLTTYEAAALARRVEKQVGTSAILYGSEFEGLFAAACGVEAALPQASMAEVWLQVKEFLKQEELWYFSRLFTKSRAEFPRAYWHLDRQGSQRDLQDEADYRLARQELYRRVRAAARRERRNGSESDWVRKATWHHSRAYHVSVAPDGVYVLWAEVPASAYLP